VVTGVIGLGLLALLARPGPAARSVSHPRPAGPTASFDYQRFAEGVGLRSADLPAGYSAAAASPSEGLSVPVPVSTCPGATGGRWLADVESRTYFSSTRLSNQVSAASEVVVLAGGANAQAVLRATRDPSYPSRCIRARSDQAVEQAIGVINQQAPCHLAFGGSTVGPVPGLSLGAGESGYRYQATLACQAEGSSETFTRDVMSTAPGRTFVQLTFSTTGGSIPPGLEQRAVSAVGNRAEGAPA
jgi:hypothetical protein